MVVKSTQNRQKENERNIIGIALALFSAQVKQVLKAKNWRKTMIQDHSRYTYHVTWSEEDGEYVGLCTEFPSLSWLDDTPETAFSGIRQVVEDAIADMQKNHESIPEPIALGPYGDQIMVPVSPEIHRNLVIQTIKLGVSLNKLAMAKLSQ